MCIKTIIIDIVPPGIANEDLTNRMHELESLVSTYGGVTIVKRIQKKHTPDYKTFIGGGKLEELIAIGSELGAELLIIGNIMKPAQIWNVNERLRKVKSQIKAWDRVDLILKIFALHAVSPESKLQIELAAIKHMGPRIFGMGMELSRQGGGSKNAKGQGETNTEIMKRHLAHKKHMIEDRLVAYEKMRQLHRAVRRKKGFATVGIVGYTNAGKTALFHKLSQKKSAQAEDKLFATLGTYVGKMWISDNSSEQVFSGKEVLLNDTIGFIRDLPPELFASFRSTLEDSIQSDILLHVIDASDVWMHEKIQTVHDILDSIGATQPKILVLNKCDLLSDCTYIEKNFPKAIFISAKSGKGIHVLKEQIGKSLQILS